MLRAVQFWAAWQPPYSHTLSEGPLAWNCLKLGKKSDEKQYKTVEYFFSGSSRYDTPLADTVESGVVLEIASVIYLFIQSVSHLQFTNLVPRPGRGPGLAKSVKGRSI